MWHYTVQNGDCLWTIAAEHHEALRTLEHNNPQFSQNWNLIYAGDEVKMSKHALHEASVITFKPKNDIRPTLVHPEVQHFNPGGGAIDGVQNAGAIYSFLVLHGLSHNAAAGVTGNIGQESGGNPWSVGDGGCGLIGWTPCSVPVGDLYAQLDDVLVYINDNGSIADLNSHAGSPSEAADWFMSNYERCNPEFCNPGNREGIADAIGFAE